MEGDFCWTVGVGDGDTDDAPAGARALPALSHRRWEWL